MLPSSSWHLPTPVLWYAGCGYVRAREDRVESTAGLGLARPVIPPVHSGGGGGAVAAASELTLGVASVLGRIKPARGQRHR